MYKICHIKKHIDFDIPKGVDAMRYTRPNIYEMLDTLSLEMKVELLEYLKADIVAMKAAPEKTYLEEQWAEIKRLIENLKYEPNIDDQFEIEEIWNICEEMIKSGRLKDEPWEIRRRVLKSIIGGEYYDYYGVIDPMRDLFKALMLTPEEKTECADIIFEIGSDYMKREGMKLYRECGQQEKYVDYLEGCLGAETEPYLELIEYYRDKDPDRAAAIAEFGLKKCKKDQTDIIIYLIQDAKQAGDDDRYSRFLKGAKMRRAVNFARVQEALDQC